MNPADLYRNDSLPQLDSTPPLSVKGLPGSATGQKPIKTTTTIPRIDTEPIYTQLKAAIGEHWTEYKAALASFMLGKLNQSELTRNLAPLLSSAPSVAGSSIHPSTSSLVSTLHLHNALIAALYANIFYREPPPDSIAPWVLATDAPSAHGGGKTATGAGAGDKVEERIKREVMALSIRDRKRLKGVNDAATTAADTEKRGDLHEARLYRDALEAVPMRGLRSADEAGGSASLGLNKDTEIKRRFAVPLAQESLEFPSRSEIQSRIEPICYEEGVSGGVASGSLQACAELVETAAETFVKELLESWMAVNRSNGSGLIQTKSFKQRVRKEEAAEDRGEVHRNAVGLLPVGADAITTREPLGLDELRLVLLLDGGRSQMDQFLAEEILADAYADVDMVDADHTLANGVNVSGVLSKHDSGINGVRTKDDRMSIGVSDPMAIDDNDWGWQGGAGSNRETLFDTLRGVMAANA